jgi:hypothetical protein
MGDIYDLKPKELISKIILGVKGVQNVALGKGCSSRRWSKDG